MLGRRDIAHWLEGAGKRDVEAALVKANTGKFEADGLLTYSEFAWEDVLGYNPKVRYPEPYPDFDKIVTEVSKKAGVPEGAIRSYVGESSFYEWLADMVSLEFQDSEHVLGYRVTSDGSSGDYIAPDFDPSALLVVSNKADDLMAEYLSSGKTVFLDKVADRLFDEYDFEDISELEDVAEKLIYDFMNGTPLGDISTALHFDLEDLQLIGLFEDVEDPFDALEDWAEGVEENLSDTEYWVDNFLANEYWDTDYDEDEDY